MPNDLRYALRYLLLRFMRMARPHVSPERYRSVATTLAVQETEQEFVLTWLRDGSQFEKRYAKDAFGFFLRGDVVEKHARRMVPHQNNLLAAKFVEEALQLPGFQPAVAPERHFPEALSSLAGYAAAAILIGLAEGAGLMPIAALIWAAAAIEFWFQKGRVIGFVPLLLLAVAGAPYTAVVAGAANLVAQLLDPNPRLRPFRSAGAGLAAVTGLAVAVNRSLPPVIDVAAGAFAIVGVAAFVVRWTSGSHFRTFPIVFPFVGVGLYLDGLAQPGLAALLCAVIAAGAAHLRVFSSAQRETAMTPNG